MAPYVTVTLEEAVEEVLDALTGLDVTYDPDQERFRSVAKAINRALRNNALEQEWGYYSDVESAGTVVAGVKSVALPEGMRPRIINDDAVRLVNENDVPVRWAYFLPRDAVHKYIAEPGLWCAATRSTLTFSRPFYDDEAGLDIQVPVMREPVRFTIPPTGTPFDQATLDQAIDFDYPQLIIARATWYYAQTDPVLQPRVQTLEAEAKDLMYQVMERDERNTESPMINDFLLPVQNGLRASALPFSRHHPHADGR